MEKSSEYYAFISYNREDEKWAIWIQRELEHYHIPLNIRRKDSSLPKDIRPVFKDTSELAAGVLVDEIKKALTLSKYLIVICSPNAAKSKWVANEVQTFIDLGREQQIIPFVIAGKPFSDNPETECFPEPLRQLHGDKELLGINIAEMGKEAAAVKIVARMFGLRFDSLWQRHEREKRKRQTIWLGLALLMLLISAGIIAYISKKNLLLDAANRDLEIANEKITEERDRANMERDRANSERNRADEARMLAEALNASLLEANDSILKQQEEIINTNMELSSSNWIAVRQNNLMLEHRARGAADNALRFIDTGDSYLARKLAEAVMPDNMSKRSYPLLPEVESALRRAWNANSFVTKGHTDAVREVAYCSDGTVIASLSDDRALKFWSPETGEEINSLDFPFSVGSFSFNPGFRKLVLTHNKRVMLFDMAESKVKSDLEDGSRLACFNADGSLVASGSPLRIWNTSTGETIQTFDIEPESVSFSLDGRWIAALGEKGQSVSVFDIESGDVVYSLKSDTYYKSVCFGQGERLAVLSLSRGYAFVLNQTGEKVLQLDGEGISALAWSPDGRFLGTGYVNGKLALLDSETGGGKDYVYDISFSPDGQSLVAAYSDHTVRVWDFTPYIHSRISALDIYHHKYVNIVSASADGHVLAQGFGKFIRCWEMPSKKVFDINTEHDYAFSKVKISPNGEYVLTVSDISLMVWSIKSSQKIMHLDLSKNKMMLAAFWFPDSKRIALQESSDISILDVSSGEVIDELEVNRNTLMSDESVDNTVLFFDTEDGTLFSWNLSDNNIDFTAYSELEGKMDRMTGKLIPSSDGRTVAIVTENSHVFFIDQESKTVKSDIFDSSAMFRAMLFNPDGNLVVADSRDGFSVWDVASGVEMNHWEGYGWPYDFRHCPQRSQLFDGVSLP